MKKMSSLHNLCVIIYIICVCVFPIICQKIINDEDSVFELYCEEVNDPPLAPCSTCKTCHHIVTGGKNQIYAFHCSTLKFHNIKWWVKNITNIINISIIIIIITVPSCCMKTTSFHISSELVPQHLDAPAGELESYIMTSCSK